MHIDIKEFIKTHWYLITTITLSLIAIIALIIGGFIKIDKSSNTQQTNCRPINTDVPISSLMISSNTTKCPSQNCCPGDSGTVVPINPSPNWYINQPSGGMPYNQLCVQTANSYCDQTSIVTDVNIVDMDDGKGNYKPMATRCCESINDPTCSYNAPVTINYPNPSMEDSGTLENSATKARMGLCVQQKLIGVVKQNKGQYINNNNLQFVSSTDTTQSGAQLCGQLGEGWVPAGENLYKGYDKAKMFLCKKYSVLQ